MASLKRLGRIIAIICILMAISIFYKLSLNTGILSTGRTNYTTTQDIYGTSLNMNSGSTKIEKYLDSKTFQLIKLRRNRTKTILFWTPRLEDPYWSMPPGSIVFKGCPYNNCEFTADKERLDEADMLLFYCQELPHFPKRRYPHQLYVHITGETPINAKINGYGMYGEDINMTVSYRKDGNLFSPYFVIEPRDDPEENYTIRIPFHNRINSIAWLVSNCRPESGRDIYVKELSKYIDVDIYGKCGNNSCDDEHDENVYGSCFRKFETFYKFYLALENNICKDYYTEKLMNSFEHEIVPIVFGGADYEHDFPKGSLINIVDFPNPKDLANYLKTMTEEEYNGHLQWKAKYRIGIRLLHCTLCEFLHDSAYTRGEQILPPSYGGNYSKWWHNSCHNDLIYQLKGKGGW